MAAEQDHEHPDKGVLPGNMGGGPLGLGDPDNTSLRRVEKEIMIPQKIKTKAKILRCPHLVEGFGKCAKDQGLLAPFNCRQAAKDLEVCLSQAYHDPEFQELCTKEYLEERAQYRRTGIKQKMKKI